MIEIYTDGSCLKNPDGPGGLSVIVVKDNNIINTFYKYYNSTTNNKMELLSILWALANYGKSAEDVIVYTDSAYSLNTYSKWMYGWENCGWVKSDGKEPENLDIIKTYYEIEQMGYHINLRKVKGHNGNKYNEMADKLARTGAL